MALKNIRLPITSFHIYHILEMLRANGIKGITLPKATSSRTVTQILTQWRIANAWKQAGRPIRADDDGTITVVAKELMPAPVEVHNVDNKGKKSIV